MPVYQTNGRRVLRVFRHIIVPILILVAITSSYFLPFASVNYSMQVISDNMLGEDNIATQVVTEEIQLGVMVYGVCKRQSSEQLQKIHDNNAALQRAGNFVGVDDERIYHNRLQLLLSTDLLKLANFLCGSNIFIDPQINTWTAAGWVVLLLLILAGMFSLLSIATHIFTLVYSQSYNRVRPNKAVTLFATASTTMISMASLLFVSLTWHERTSAAQFGSGFIIILTVTVLILCGHIIGSILTSCKPKPKRKKDIPLETAMNTKEGSVII